MATNSKYTVVRYGLCLNDHCSKSKAKVLQQINGRKEFVCEECGKPLRECPPPRSWWNKNGKALLGVLAIVAVLSAGSFFVMSPKSESSIEPPVSSDPEVIEVTPVAEDSVQAIEEQPVVPTPATGKKDTVPAKETTVAANNSLDLGYASYKGRIKNGVPHDENGRMTFKEKHLIDKRDSQKRMAEPGDYIIGEYVNGKLVQGIWYNEKNTVKGSIIIGL